MLEELLKYERLGSKDELMFLLFKALPLSKSQKVKDLKQYCTSNHFSIGRSFDGILKLLEFISFISVSNGIVSINRELFDPSRIERPETFLENGDFIEGILSSLKREGAMADFVSPDALRLDADSGLFYLKESLIPLRFFAIRNVLISVGLFERNSTLRSNSLFVRVDATDIFKALVVDPLREHSRTSKRKITRFELKTQLNRQEELGEKAEIFVVGFEQQRLHGHPSIDEIRRVSEDHANAGYDIESFNDKQSVFTDRFIEVKSYSDNVVFHWSQNEIDTAKELAQKYFLYLVDRNKMSQSGYAPRIFQNPYQKLFENEFWVKEPEAWKVSGPRENQT